MWGSAVRKKPYSSIAVRDVLNVTVSFIGGALIAVSAGCNSSTPRDSSATHAAGMAASGQSATTSGQPIVIQTVDRGIVLGLVHDTVYMGLSDSLLTKARTDMTRDRADTGVLGGAFAAFIKKTVGNALGTRVRYPISDIQSVRYEDGEIKFEYRNKHAMSFESISGHDTKALADFAPSDARRFVAAVNASLRTDDATQ